MGKEAIAFREAQNLKKKNEQGNHRGVDGIAIDSNQNVDEKLATHFYNFLIGKSNQIPTFEFIDYIKSLTDNELISANCGVFVYENLDIVAVDLFSDGTERRDIITADSNTAQHVNKDAVYGSLEVDPEKYPRFSKDRVEIVQNLIKEYRELHKNDKIGMSR